MLTLGYILLKGKEFTIPDEVAYGIIGTFFGIIVGLFYYQSYRRTYYWWYSIGTSFGLAMLSKALLPRIPGFDANSIWSVPIMFLLPFLGTLGVNQYLYFRKNQLRKKRRKRKQHSSFFDTPESTTAVRDVTTTRPL